jgi:hypothetical protein
MSDYLVIIIKKKDLEKNRKRIYGDMHKFVSDKMIAAMDEINNALNARTVKFTELEIVIIQPEFTNHNKLVRELLDDYGIKYQTMIW